MMKRILLSGITLLFAGAVFAFTAIQGWQITDKYAIRFSSNEVGGIFKTFSGDIAFDEQNLAASKFNVAVDVASINTGNGLQNKHAKSDEWFDAAKYPQIKFTSDKIVKAGSGYQVTGTLEMHGIKKSISFPFTFVRKGNEGSFSGSFTVNRSDFKIGKPGGEVSEAIKVELVVPVVKK